MTDCPDCSALLIERVSANGNGNDLLDRCESCGWFRVDHQKYPHNDETSHLFKYRHGLSDGASRSAIDSPCSPVAEPEPKLCECNCGARAPIAKATNRAKGHIKGQPVRFIHGHGRRHNNFGQF